MYTTFIIDSVSVLLLAGAFFILWRQRIHIYSWRPLLPALVFLAAGHIGDMLVEHPSLRLGGYLGVSNASFERFTLIIGNIADNLGVALLIYGFVTVMKYEREEERRIKEMERMLPLCSSCKKYRTADGHWLPIEQYLIDNGAPTLTHGICPDCQEKLYGRFLTGERH